MAYYLSVQVVCITELIKQLVMEVPYWVPAYR